jgi:NADPH:quinone reductase-like Zn-dependent oxidoreductase
MEVVKLTHGRGSDLVFEIGGAETFPQSIRATRTNGVIAAIGNVTGSVGEVNWPLLFMFKKNITGISAGCTQDYEAICRAVEGTGMRPMVDEKVYNSGKIKSAIRSITDGKHFGSITIEY